MKRLLFILIAVFYIANCFSQSRKNEKEISLDYKSKEITSAKYWQNSNGKWKSRSNKKLSYVSGIQDDNFNSIFIGELDTLKCFFIDYFKGEYRYPHIEKDWRFRRSLFCGIITDNDCNNLKNIQQNQEVNIITNFSNEMYKDHMEYRFSFFLSITKTLYSSSLVVYDSYIKTDGEDYAKRKYKEDYPPKYIFAVKRTMNEGEDVVRFCVFPAYLDLGKPILIDSFYFEIPYNKYLELFVSDKNTNYK